MEAGFVFGSIGCTALSFPYAVIRPEEITSDKLCPVAVNTFLIGVLTPRSQFFPQTARTDYPRREAVGKPLSILTLPSDLALVFSGIDQVIKTQKGETVDTVRIHKDGGELWLNITFSPVKNESGELIGISTIARDITNRKLDEEKSRENSQRLRMILENAREYAIFSLALDRTVTSWNAGAKKILGYEEAEIVGKSGDVIFTAQDREAGAPEKESSMAFSTGRASDERWHQRKDGSQFWGSGVMMLMRDPEEKPIGLVKKVNLFLSRSWILALALNRR